MRPARSCLNAPCGAGCFLAWLRWSPGWPRRSSLNAPSGAGCFLTPASGNGIVAPLLEAGAPPAPQAPRGTGRQCPYLTTFRRPDAKRHRHPLRHQFPTTSSQKVDVPSRDCRHIVLPWLGRCAAGSRPLHLLLALAAEERRPLELPVQAASPPVVSSERKR